MPSLHYGLLSTIWLTKPFTSLAQNLDLADGPLTGPGKKLARYFDYNYSRLFLLPEVGRCGERAEQLIAIAKETLVFDDPFCDMISQIEEAVERGNSILRAFAWLKTQEDYPFSLVFFERWHPLRLV